MKHLLAAVTVAVIAVANTALADSPGCNQCGCGQCVKKVCRIICEPKKETKWVYCCVCEDFCLPGPSKKCGERCVPDCTDCDGVRKEIIWKPSCGPIRTKKKLVKMPVTIEKPGYKCIVVCICNGCGCRQVDECATAEYEASGILPVDAEIEDVVETPELTQAPESVEPAVETPAEEPAAANAEASQPSILGRLFRR